MIFILVLLNCAYELFLMNGMPLQYREKPLENVCIPCSARDVIVSIRPMILLQSVHIWMPMSAEWTK